jgi:DNA repair exonuclease SbcCD ATPase subunit
VALKVRRDKRRKKSAGKRDQGSSSNRQQKALIAKRDTVTRTIEEAEARVHEINEVFCDPSYFDRTPPKEVKKLEMEQKQLKERIEELMGEWTAVEDELTALDP